MLERSRDWNVSFAGCGFMAVYYVGVSCCLMERARGLLDNAAKISGASSGAITGAVIACRIPFVKSCESLMDMAREASKRNLSTLHPSFNLMRFVRDFLHRELPEDAHLLASGKLCVSLTRLTDGENVIASQFDSKEELIQAILCSCFFPVCCGMIPPAFRGVRYVDGALSDNLPYCKLKNTITVSPFAGESDICPKEGPYFYQEVRYFNVSINVNRNNLCRVSRIFLPPRPEVLAELCQSGYRDALQFLLENDLVKLELLAELSPTEEGPTQATCCDARLLSHTAVDGGDSTEAWPAECSCYEEEQHWWFDDLTVDLLPVHIKKVFCKACKDMYGPSVPVRHLLLVRMLLFLLVLFVLPVELVCALACRFVEWAPEMASDVAWLCDLSRDVYKQIWKRLHQGNPFLKPSISATSTLALPPTPVKISEEKGFPPGAHLLPPTPPATPPVYSKEQCTVRDRSMLAETA